MKDTQRERKWGIPLTTVQQMRLMTAPHIICCCCRIYSSSQDRGGFLRLLPSLLCNINYCVYIISCLVINMQTVCAYSIQYSAGLQPNNKQKTPKLFIDEEETQKKKTILNEHFPFVFFFLLSYFCSIPLSSSFLLLKGTVINLPLVSLVRTNEYIEGGKNKKINKRILNLFFFFFLLIL